MKFAQILLSLFAAAFVATKASSAKSFSLYLNTGSSITYNGISWINDSPYVRGRSSIYTNPNSTAVPDLLMRSERYWFVSNVTSTSGIHIAVPYTGTYRVTLYFAEMFYAQINRRRFNMRVNGDNVFASNIDLLQTYGYATWVTVTKEISVVAANKAINITLVTDLENPKYNGVSVELLQVVTQSPSAEPSASPSANPSAQPSVSPSANPSAQPSAKPSAQPSAKPSANPSAQPSAKPSAQPSAKPSANPSVQPSAKPSAQPSAMPSANPSAYPSANPSAQPSSMPSANPSAQPSAKPSAQPSAMPSANPSAQPSASPSAQPSAKPSANPSAQPSANPSAQPSAKPSSNPSAQPSTSPSAQPSAKPSAAPSVQPSANPSAKPSAQPSATPSAQPSANPSAVPSANPSASPTLTPTTPADLYVNCGPTVVYNGNTWVADSSYATGGSIHTTTNAKVTDLLAQSERVWTSSSVTTLTGETIPVIAGVYTVTLYFAEIFFGSANRRTFNVQVNGVDVFASPIDLFSTYGFGTLGSVSLDVTMSAAGNIRITFVTGIQNPKLTAFSVIYKSAVVTTPAPTTPFVPFALHVNCGSSLTDSSGQLWVSDSTYTNGGKLYTTSDVAVTNALARTERYWPRAVITASSGELVTGLDAGTYNVSIYVAEIFWRKANQRKFNLEINGVNLFSSPIDLAATYTWGSMQAFSTDVKVTDGQIFIRVVQSVENPKLSAFSVVRRNV